MLDGIPACKERQTLKVSTNGCPVLLIQLLWSFLPTNICPLPTSFLVCINSGETHPEYAQLAPTMSLFRHIREEAQEHAIDE